jgi:lysophospholipase L1-like esterase
MRVLVFGASITQGFWDSEGGWVARLRRYYDKLQIQDLKNNDQPTVFNLGISGDTTRGVLKRLENEVKARVWPGEEFAFIFCIGTNNTLIKKDGTNLSNPEEYAVDIQKIIDQAREYSQNILLVELPPCDESLTQPVFWADVSYTNERIELFNETLRRLAGKNNLPLVLVFEEFKKRLESGDDLLADGLHPNDAGHQIIFELVLPRLNELLNT